MQVLFNNTIISDEDSLLLLNRGLKFGDALFETIRVMNGRALFVEDHFKRLTESLQLLQMIWPAEYDKQWFESLLNKYIYDNKLHQARIRFTVFRTGAGLYTPQQNNVHWLLESAEVPQTDYSVEEKGQVFCLYADLYKPSYFLSRIKTTNTLLFVMAGLYMQRQGADNCFILNEQGFVVEAMSSNVFIVKNNIVFTPPVSDGALPGIMRQRVLLLLKNMQMTTVEASLTVKDLEMADEIFTTNVIIGVQWCQSFNGRHYANAVVSVISHSLCPL